MLYRIKIRLDTMQDIYEFVKICSSFKGVMKLVDVKGDQKINATSLLGCMSTVDWSEIWFESDIDLASRLTKFMI